MGETLFPLSCVKEITQMQMGEEESEPHIIVQCFAEPGKSRQIGTH